MLKELRESYVSKFDSPMTALLYYRSNEGWCDEETGSVEWEGWYGRIGKRIVQEDDRGFVTSHRYITEVEAIGTMELIAADYAEWIGDDNDDT